MASRGIAVNFHDPTTEVGGIATVFHGIAQVLQGRPCHILIKPNA